MSEEREAKRARQACQNCRRKKTRCSGEKPVCAFCAKLKQECKYDDGFATEITLAARVALLESKLSLLAARGSNVDFGLPFDSSEHGRKTPDREISPANRRLSVVEPSLERHLDCKSKFASLPPPEVVLAITDTYFQYCHKQPYCYFVESFFHRRLQEGQLPSYLLMAVVAMAARFSHDPFFQGVQQSAIEIYSRVAWAQIYEKSFWEDDALDITVVQATNMLAVVDFTTGKHKLAWVKIGLSVRFAQSLQLTDEPSEDLTSEQRAERTLTFWSVYLLDRLASCGTNRPPTIADSDFTVRLPSDSAALGVKSEIDAPSLQSMQDLPDTDATSNLSHFAHMILMASALGRIGRFCLLKHGSSEIWPLWHERSEYTKLNCLLMSFESYSDSSYVPLHEALEQWYTPEGLVDQQRAGHFTFSVILYNLNHCLLHHPFLLQNHLRFCKTRVPPSFLKQALQRGREHAQNLTVALHTVQKKGVSLASFYAYACTVAGTIHKLYMQHEDPKISDTASQLFECSVEFLQYGQRVWKHYPRMASALLQFDPDPLAAKILVSGSGAAASPSEWSSDPNLDVIWDLLDYGWLSDSARSCCPKADKPCQNGGQWDTKHTFWSDHHTGAEMANLVEDIGTVTSDLNSFNPTAQDNSYDTWSEILDAGETIFTFDPNTDNRLPSHVI